MPKGNYTSNGGWSTKWTREELNILKQWNPNNFAPKSPLRNQIYYDMIRPKGKKNGLIFDDHQRIELRILARFSDPYLCIPRRYW